MTQTIEKTKYPILMKSKLVHFVSQDIAEKIQQQLLQQTGHTFIKIIELGITINTAEIEGVYTMEQYESLIRIKQGEWLCIYKKWHGKKAECRCQEEINRERIEERKRKEDAKNNHPQTPEEKMKISARIKEIKDWLKKETAEKI